MSLPLTEFQRMLFERFRAHRAQLWDWHLSHAKQAPPPFYSSVDLRDASDKIAPVDSNLFPAGFNNICPEDLRTTPMIARAQLQAAFERAGGSGQLRRVAILPESHTTNLYYLDNLSTLEQLLREAGFEVRVGWVVAAETPSATPAPSVLTSHSGQQIHYTPIAVDPSGTLTLGDWEPELCVLNNDFSAGYPTLLDRVRQPLVPHPRMGWHTRTKSAHFERYNRLVSEFARVVDVDPWLLSIASRGVDNVNFGDDQGIDRVAETAAGLLDELRVEYRARGITRQPYVYVKNNSGTYGMGILIVHSAEELRGLNRRERNKMSVGKNRSPITSVVVQEGIPTATLVDRLASEPVIYLMGCELIGGFLRTNAERGVEDNLNSKGMVFRKLCMSDLQEPSAAPERDRERDPEAGADNPLELIYGSVARISALAAGQEIVESQSRFGH